MLKTAVSIMLTPPAPSYGVPAVATIQLFGRLGRHTYVSSRGLRRGSREVLGVLDGSRVGLAPLRVAVEARDVVRQASLAALVAAAGHEVVPPSEAEIVLVDQPTPSILPQLVMSNYLVPGGGVSLLPTGAGVRQIDAALRAVAAGLIVHTRAEASSTGLTPRETEVLGCLIDGASNKVIARRLGISQHTVKFHVEAIFIKLAVTSRAEAVAKSLRGQFGGF